MKLAPAASHSDEAWSTARRAARELDKILEGSGSRRAAIVRAAAELCLSTRQVYNLLARYRVDRTVTSLLPGGDRTRKKRLQPEIEEIIATTLREQWLVLEAPPLAPVVAEIRARCEEAGLSPPSYLTVARRIPALFGPEEIAKKRSANLKHLHRLRARPGYIHAAHPLDVCQIDHTPTDINFVEVVEGGGTFVGRAYLTIVTDVATRCILGFCLTLENASARRLERAIADICRVEWVRDSARTSDAVSRVLRTPVTAEVRSGRKLTNLSTAARIRCFEALAAKPPDWLVKDMEGTDAYRRWMIVAAGGHEAMIARFADFLETHQGSPRRKRLPPAADRSALFTAYFRIMQSGSRHRGRQPAEY